MFCFLVVRCIENKVKKKDTRLGTAVYMQWAFFSHPRGRQGCF